MWKAFGLAAALIATAPAAAAPPPAAAPLTLADMPLHDPWIVADKASGTYYLYTSNIPRLTGTPGVGTMAYASRDLRRWTAPKMVFSLPAGTWADGGGWAPEVHRHAGRWWLLVTLHNEAKPLAEAAPGRTPIRRGTVLAVADQPDGPFTLVRDGAPIAPAGLATLDATLYQDKAGKPWVVYAHEWTQVTDGTIEAAPLTDAFVAAGPPIILFHASDAPWAVGQPQKAPDDKVYVTDGPELFRTRTGTLLILWSSWGADGYVQSVARSRSGEIAGPWEQLPPLLHQDSGHGMLFETFDGQLMLIVHRPFKNARGKLYAMRDLGDRLEIVRQRTDLDGDPPVP